MYAMIDAEYFVSCLFFIVCLVLLNFWLMNIFVAVIINTFGNIREETKHSAFAGRSWVPRMLHSESFIVTNSLCHSRTNVLDEQARNIEKEGRSFSTIWRRRIAFVSKWTWTAAIIADVGIQASKTAEDTPERVKWLSKSLVHYFLCQCTAVTN